MSILAKGVALKLEQMSALRVSKKIKTLKLEILKIFTCVAL